MKLVPMRQRWNEVCDALRHGTQRVPKWVPTEPAGTR